MRVQARNNMVEKIYQGNIYFMLHWYKVHVCVLKYIIWWTYMKPVKRCENRILLCMWLGEYMAWDNRTLKVIDPFSYVLLNISARNIFRISILKVLWVFEQTINVLLSSVYNVKFSIIWCYADVAGR